MIDTEPLYTPNADLRDRPRRIGLAIAYVGERLECAGIAIQQAAYELQYLKLRAWRRWGK